MFISINGKTISEESIFQEMQYHPAATREDAAQKAALALTIKTLLLQEADKKGISPPDTLTTQETLDEFKINLLLENELKLPELTEADCKNHYDKNQKQFCDREGNIVPFEFVKEPIGNYLKERAWQVASKQYLKILAGKAHIEGIDLASADSMLVQ